MTPLRLDAPAKLNLSLQVVGRRAGGLHELESRLVLLELADLLLLMPGCSGLRVEGATPDVPIEPSRNLAWRGLVAGIGDEPRLACLTLDKRVPSAAGLGGGSSDAASGWRLGRRWIGIDRAPADAEIAALATIGADVPFFAAATPAAHVRGIGEAVEPTEVPAAREVVLVHPPFTLSTAAVFAELRPNDGSTPDAAGERNDLLAPALRLRPELETIIARVAAAGATPRLTGSGPTLFVVDADSEHVNDVAERLRRDGLHVTRTRLRTAAARIEPFVEEA